jgi:hypothetical protein
MTDYQQDTSTLLGATRAGAARVMLHDSCRSRSRGGEKTTRLAAFKKTVIDR